MQISETQFKKLPEHLSRLFKKAPNHGSDDVLAAFPVTPGALAPATGDEPSSSTASVYGKFKRAASDRTGESSANSDNLGAVGFKMKPGTRRDATSAARLFYCAKASKRDRDEGLVLLPNRKAGSLNMCTDGHSERNGQTTTDRKNIHPTVKPTDLMRYLCRLVTPPGGVVLDPFMGSGSTGKAAALEGLAFIGVEREPEYVAIAEARIAAAQSAAEKSEEPELQPDLFGSVA